MIQLMINGELWSGLLINNKDEKGDWIPYKIVFDGKPLDSWKTTKRYPVFFGTSSSELYISWLDSKVLLKDEEIKSISEQYQKFTNHENTTLHF